MLEWATRVVNDFERDAPPKSTLKRKKDCQQGAEQLAECMDRACLHVWLLSTDVNCLKVVKTLTGSKLDKYKQMWAKGCRVD